MNLKLSPEIMILLPMFAMLDILGWVLVCVGLDDFGITDIIGFVLGGVCLMSSGGKLPDVKKQGYKFFGASAVEAAPYLGSLSPTWTLWFLNFYQEKMKMEQQKQEQENQNKQPEENQNEK